MNRIKYWGISLIVLLMGCNQKNENKSSDLSKGRDTIEFEDLFLKNNETERERGDFGSFYNSDTVFFHDKKIIILESVRFQKIVKINVLNKKLNTTIDSLLFGAEYLKSKKIHNSSSISFIWSENKGQLKALDTRKEKNILFDLRLEKSGKIIVLKD